MDEGQQLNTRESVPPRKARLKLAVIAGGATAALLVAVGLYFGGMLGGGKKDRPAAQSASSVESAQPIFVETPEMITNLDAGPHRLSFVKVQCKIELAHAAEVQEMTASMPRVLDLIQTYLRETRPEELRSDTGTYRLREALLSRASIAVPQVHVKDVLFEELIVQ